MDNTSEVSRVMSEEPDLSAIIFGLQDSMEEFDRRLARIEHALFPKTSESKVTIAQLVVLAESLDNQKRYKNADSVTNLLARLGY